MTLVSAIVVNLDRQDLLEPCLTSIEAAMVGIDGEVVVVDNGSRDGSVDMVTRRFPAVRVERLAGNAGFAGGMEAGLRVASGEWILALNNDTTIAPDAVGVLLDAAASAPDIGAVAAQMRFADRPDHVNSAGIEIDVLGVAYDLGLGELVQATPSPTPVEVFGVSAGAALYRRRTLDEVGGFCADFFAYLEDVDVAWRARMRGWRSLHAPAAVVLHHHSATATHASPFKYELVGRNRVRLLARNMPTRELLRRLPAIVAYELAYIAFVAVRDRTLAPLRGRLAGLRGWREDRRAGASLRRPVALAPARGARQALARRATFTA